MARDNIIYRNPQATGIYDRRQYTETEWKYIPITLYVNGAGASTFSPLVGPHISRLFIVRISAFYASGAPGSDTVISLQDFTSGGPVTLASLTLPAALATGTEITDTFQEVEIGPQVLAVLAVETDGGHRDIFATAYAGQSPLRR